MPPPPRLIPSPQVSSRLYIPHSAHKSRIRPNQALNLSKKPTRQPRCPSRKYSTTASTPPRADNTPIHPVHQPTNPTLLRRLPSSARALPGLPTVAARWMWIRTIPPFLLIIWASAAALFNYQKTNSPILTATLYALRTDPRVRALLGSEIYFASRVPWISGEINLVQGRVDITFNVKGTEGRGTCRFRAKRYGGRGGEFRTEEWSLAMDEGGSGKGRTVHLLEGNARGDPLGGQSF